MTNDIQDEDLQKIIDALPREIAPGRDLWPGIAARIAPRRQLYRYWPAAATLAVAAVTGAIVVFIMLSRPMASRSVAIAPAARKSVPVTMPQTPRAQTLAATVRRTTQLDPKTQAVLLRNLAIIENSLDNIQHALQKNPDNVGLQRLLYQMYRSEAALVNAAGRVQLQTTTGVVL